MLVTFTISTVNWCLGRAQRDIYIYTYTHIYHILLGRQLRGIITLSKVKIGRNCSNWNVTGLGAWVHPTRKPIWRFPIVLGVWSLVKHSDSPGWRPHARSGGLVFCCLKDSEMIENWKNCFFVGEMFWMSHSKDYRRIGFYLSPYSHFL